MRKTAFFCLALILMSGLNQTYSQVGIGTTNPDPASMLDVVSVTQGLLAPRMTAAERNSIATPPKGLLVYCTTDNHFYVNKGTSVSSNWVMMSTQWLQTGGGSDTWYSAGKVGVGTSPVYSFDVAGDLNFSGTLRKNGSPVATGVSTVTATPPVFSSGGSTPDISILKSGPTQNGYLSSADWNTFNSKISSQWITFGPDIYYPAGFVGVGTTAPVTNLHLSENNVDVIPSLQIEQLGAGDAAMEYKKPALSISSGIHQADNLSYKICANPVLAGVVYNAPGQLFRIHTAAGKQGITDFNHQSRCRAHMIVNGIVPMGVWTLLPFGQKTFDEQNEFIIGNGTFIARSDGYYQVNARVEFNPSEAMVFLPNGYVSIAIFKNGTVYAEGNNLQITLGANPPYQVLYHNNAPNVSDVLWLSAGDIVDIRVFQTYSAQPAFTMPNHEKTYFSIHKSS